MTDATPQPPALLDTLVGYALRRAQLQVFQHLVDSLASHDLRPAQLTALLILEQEPGLMQADLARKLAIEPPQLVLLLNKLEALGLAQRLKAESDKRAYSLYLTAKAEAMLEGLKACASASDLAATQALSAGERRELLRLLRKLSAA